MWIHIVHVGDTLMLFAPPDRIAEILGRNESGPGAKDGSRLICAWGSALAA